MCYCKEAYLPSLWAVVGSSFSVVPPVFASFYFLRRRSSVLLLTSRRLKPNKELINLLIKMSSLASRFAKFLRVSSPIASTSHPVVGFQRSFRSLYSTESSSGDDDSGKDNELDEEFDIGGKPDLEIHGVDPRRGWGFRGVHKAIICGKVGQDPVQKILRNGRTVTIFTVGTGGMFDQRIVGAKDLPKPAQWHRIAVHNETLGAYVVQKLSKNSSVFVEGDIETRIYNDSISGEVKNIPEICVRRNGKVRLVTSGKNVTDISFDDLREGLFG